MTQASERNKPIEGADALIERHIALDPFKGQARSEAILKDYGVHVWAIIGHMRMMSEDVTTTAQSYEVSEEAVEAAVAWYQRYDREIDDRLRANRSVRE